MKIIAITSRYNAGFVDQIKELGADAVLLRPIAPQEWVETVQAMLTA